MATYWLYRLASIIVPRVPARLGYFLADLAGELAYLLNWSSRRNVNGNLSRVLGAANHNRQDIVRRVFRTGARNYFELFRLQSLDVEYINKVVTVEGWDHITDAMVEGKGVIAVAAHIGSFDLVTQVARSRNITVTLPVERVRPDRLFELVRRLRACQGLNLVSAGEGAVKTIYRALQDNHLVVIAADRDVQHSGMLVEFFGALTTVPTAPAIIARRTGAPVLPCCCLRRDDGSHIVHFDPPLELVHSPDRKQDIMRNTERIVRALEGFIRQHPDQWVVFRPVWDNTRPTAVNTTDDP